MSGRLSSRLVAGVWVAMTLAALGFVAAFGVNVPWEDDWTGVPAICGEWRLHLWVLAQQNEHRIPVSRFLFWALARITGFDSRAGMVFDVIQLSALAGAMILVARRVRGSTRWTDLLFPVALLHFGHWWNLLMNIQICVVSGAVLFGVLLLFVHAEGWRHRGWVAVISLTVILLPMHGGYGLFVLPPCAALLFRCAAARWREGARRDPLLLAGASTIALALVPIYFLGLGSLMDRLILPGAGAPIRPWPLVSTAAQFLSQGFGTFPPSHWRIPALVVAVLIAATLTLIALRWRRAPLLAFGELCCLGAVGLLAAAVGHGRSAQEDGGLPVRLITPATMLPVAMYLIWDKLGEGRARAVVQSAIVGCVLALLPLSTWSGLREGAARRETLQAVERDIAAGRSEAEIAARHFQRIFPWSEWHLRETLRSLRREGLGPYRGMTAEPASPE